MEGISGTSLTFTTEASVGESFSGALSGFLAWENWEIGIPGVNRFPHDNWPGTLTETAFNFIDMSPYCDIQSTWMGTQYLCMMVWEINYADTCYYSTIYPDACARITTDLTYDTDLVSVVVGDFTFAGDMPITGTSGFRVKALAKYHADNGEVSAYHRQCGQFLYEHVPLDCGPVMRGALTADQFLTANFTDTWGTGTLTGSLALEYDLYFANTYSAPAMNQEKILGRFTFKDVKISGNSFAGEIISYPNFQGRVYGHFFGPDGKEIGGVISFTDAQIFYSTTYPEGIALREGDYEHAWGVVAFAGAMN
jgi:hypothetical protein